MRTISIIHVDVLEKVYVLLISAKQPKHSPRSYNCIIFHPTQKHSQLRNIVFYDCTKYGRFCKLNSSACIEPMNETRANIMIVMQIIVYPKVELNWPNMTLNNSTWLEISKQNSFLRVVFRQPPTAAIMKTVISVQ